MGDNGMDNIIGHASKQDHLWPEHECNFVFANIVSPARFCKY